MLHAQIGLSVGGELNVGFKLSEEWEKPVFVEMVNQVDFSAH